MEFINVGVGEVSKLAAVFGFDDDGVVVAVMFESVETRFEFAFTGLGAGEFLGTGTVGGESNFGHGFRAWMDHGRWIAINVELRSIYFSLDFS